MYKSKYYDPVKAHEYYMKHRKLKGRKKATAKKTTSKGRKAGKSAAQKAAEKLQKEQEKAAKKKLKEEEKAKKAAEKAAKKSAKGSKGSTAKGKTAKAPKTKKSSAGTTSTKGLNAAGLKSAQDAKARIDEEKKNFTARLNRLMREKIEALQNSTQGMTAEERGAKIRAIREEYDSIKTQAAELFKTKYIQELDKIKSDSNNLE